MRLIVFGDTPKLRAAATPASFEDRIAITSAGLSFAAQWSDPRFKFGLSFDFHAIRPFLEASCMLSL